MIGRADIGGTLILDSKIPVGARPRLVGRGRRWRHGARDGGHGRGARCPAYPRDAERAEGHLDNAAPTLLGGLVGVAHGRPFSLPLASSSAFVFAAPGFELATSRARAALPATVTHGEAVRALGRVAALVRALETGDPELLALGLDDTLHVPYRLPLIPGGAEVVAAGTRAGAYGVTVSGAGSDSRHRAPRAGGRCCRRDGGGLSTTRRTRWRHCVVALLTSRDCG